MKSSRRGLEPGAPKQPRTDSTAHRLPASRAFVVQLPGGDLHGQPLCGRVEHVLSGRSTRFQSLEHLAQFFAEVLAADDSTAMGGTSERATKSRGTDENDG